MTGRNRLTELPSHLCAPQLGFLDELNDFHRARIQHNAIGANPNITNFNFSKIIDNNVVVLRNFKVGDKFEYCSRKTPPKTPLL